MHKNAFGVYLVFIAAKSYEKIRIDKRAGGTVSYASRSRLLGCLFKVDHHICLCLWSRFWRFFCLFNQPCKQLLLLSNHGWYIFVRIILWMFFTFTDATKHPFNIRVCLNHWKKNIRVFHSSLYTFSCLLLEPNFLPAHS